MHTYMSMISCIYKHMKHTLKYAYMTIKDNLFVYESTYEGSLKHTLVHIFSYIFVIFNLYQPFF